MPSYALHQPTQHTHYTTRLPSQPHIIPSTAAITPHEVPQPPSRLCRTAQYTLYRHIQHIQYTHTIHTLIYFPRKRRKKRKERKCNPQYNHAYLCPRTAGQTYIKIHKMLRSKDSTHIPHFQKFFFIPLSLLLYCAVLVNPRTTVLFHT